MTATLILAGGEMPPELAPFAEGAANRALIRVGAGSETMLDFVVCAVHGGTTGRIFVAGNVPTPDGCIAVAGGESLLETLLSGVNALRPEETRLLIVTADAPFLTAESVADFLTRAEAVQPTPFVYPLIEAERCRAAFPGMKRTTLRIAEGEFTGGNLALVDPAFLRQSGDAIRAAYNRRKDRWGLAKMLGAGIIARFLLSRLYPPLLAIRDVETAIGRLLGSATPRAVISPFAAVGTDVDRPEDIVIAREILAKDAAMVATIARDRNHK